MKTVLVHDGSFPGFLCAAAELLNAPSDERSEFVVRGPRDALELFEAVTSVPRDDDRALTMIRRLGARAGEAALRTILEAFLSDVPGADSAAAAMLALLRDRGPRALDGLSDPVAASVERAALRTRREAHRFLGIVRFSQLSDGHWYAPVEPDCDILPLIAGHFSSRFPSMRWVIHDVRRGRAVLHERGDAWTHVEGFCLATPTPALSESEEFTRELWRRYFASVSIDIRENPRLQTAFLPKKHRKYLPETNA